MYRYNQRRNDSIERRRQRERIHVDPEYLRFNASSDEDWDRRRASSRRVNESIRFVEEWPSCLQKIQWDKKMKGDLLAPFQGRIIPKNTTIMPNYQRRTEDTPAIELIRDKMMEEVRKMYRNGWMENAVIILLGPEHLKRLSDDPKLRFEGKLHKVLIKDSFAFLFVEVKGQRVGTDRVIRGFLNQFQIEKDSVTISEASSAHGMLLNYGEDPKFILDPEESRFAVVNDDKKEKYRDGVVSSRHISLPEKRYIEERIRKYNNGSITLLEFPSIESRKEAMKEEEGHFDLFYCDSMFDVKRHHESLHLYIKYEMNPKQPSGICLTFKVKEELKRSERAFSFVSSLSFHYYDENWKEIHVEHDNSWREIDISHKVNNRKMILKNFPRHLRTFESRKWFVEKMLKGCRMESRVERIEEYIERQPDSFRTFLSAKMKNLRSEVEKEIGKVEEKYGLNVVEEGKQKKDLWMVKRRNEGQNQREEVLTVHFKDMKTGRSYVRAILKESSSRPIFSVDSNDKIGPQLIPCYRNSFAVSRSIRGVMNEKIKRLDREIRETFSLLSEKNDSIMELEDSEYFNGRIYEEWKEEEDMGIIGIQGWNMELVKLFASKLEKCLEPLQFEGNADLLFGIGEVYVKSLMGKYRNLVVEVDKFTEKVLLFGDHAEKALEDLRIFSKETTGVITEIPIRIPYFNNQILHFLTEENVKNIRKSLGIQKLIQVKGVLQFEGSIGAYEELMKLLEEMSSELFKMETVEITNPLLTTTNCPTCWTEIPSSSDFYRFQCGHVMCRSCTNNKIKNLKSTEMKMPCEHEGCGKSIAPSDLMNIILGGPNRIRDFDAQKLKPLTDAAKQAILSATRDAIPCPTPDCNGILSKSEGDRNEFKKCLLCARKYCRNCLAGHFPTSCEEFERLRQPDASIEAYKTEMGPGTVKQCPQCGVHMEKQTGCNHMECKCGTHFCWICLFKSPNGSGPIYAHMSEVHGGHGANINLLELEDADPQLQRLMMQNFRNVEEDDDDDDLDEIDEIEEAIFQRDFFHPQNERFGEIRNRAGPVQPELPGWRQMLQHPQMGPQMIRNMNAMNPMREVEE